MLRVHSWVAERKVEAGPTQVGRPRPGGAWRGRVGGPSADGVQFSPQRWMSLWDGERKNCRDCPGKSGREAGKEGALDSVPDLWGTAKEMRTRQGRCIGQPRGRGEAEASTPD